MRNLYHRRQSEPLGELPECLWGGRLMEPAPRRRHRACLHLCNLGLGRTTGAPAGRARRPHRSLDRAVERVGPQSPELLAILEPLADKRFLAGEIGEASLLRRRALRIEIAAFGAGSVPPADAMVALAVVHIEMRRYLDAEPLLIAARDIVTGQLGPDDPRLAAVLSGLARVALGEG